MRSSLRVVVFTFAAGALSFPLSVAPGLAQEISPGEKAPVAAQSDAPAAASDRPAPSADGTPPSGDRPDSLDRLPPFDRPLPRQPGRLHRPAEALPSATVPALGVPMPERPAEQASGLEAAEGDPAAASQPQTDLQFSFRAAPWPEVLRHFADWAGLTLDLTDVPEGTFSYYDNRRHTAAEAIDILNGYLLPRGYVLLRRDQFLTALKTDNEILPNLVPTVPLAELDQRGENELLRVVVPLNDVSPEKAAEEIGGMLGPLGLATPLETSQSIVVRGFGRSLRDVAALLTDAKPPASHDKLEFRAFPLEHLPAADAVRQIQNLFGISSGPTNVSGARSAIEREMRRNRSRRRGDDDDDRRSQPTPLLAEMAVNMQVSALQRTNHVLVTATPAGLALVEEILKSIDVPLEGDSAAQALENSTPVLRVYTVNDADEGEVAKTLDVVFPGVVVNEDRRQDTIHVLATPSEHAEVEGIIRTLDSGGSGGRMVEVIRLKRFEPYAMSSLLGGMFANERSSERPVIQAEPGTRTLVVRGTEAQVEQIRRALAAYGEGDLAAGERSDGSRFRSIPIGGNSAETVARTVEEVLSLDRQFENPIRVVVPGGEKPPAVQPSSEQRDRDNRAAASGRRIRHIQTVALADTDSDAKPDAQAADDAGDEPTQPRRPAPRRAQVTIEVRGDQLFLYSADPQAVEQVEETIRDLVQALPSRTQWTIFYLRSAEAEATATQLNQLLPSEAFYPSTESAGGSLGATAQPLRIVSDPRTNALFASGAATYLDQIERLLEYLDTNERPESFRDRVPRTIPVQYADLNAMADMVRTLYAGYIASPAARRGNDDDRNRGDQRDQRDQRESNREQQRNSERDERRGDDPRRSQRGEAGDRNQATGRMTLAVDQRARELIVVCDEPLYREVSELVRERDLAARDEPVAIDVIRLKSPAAVKAALALEGLPNVEVKTVEPSEVGIPPRPERRRER